MYAKCSTENRNKVSQMAFLAFAYHNSAFIGLSPIQSIYNRSPVFFFAHTDQKSESETSMTSNSSGFCCAYFQRNTIGKGMNTLLWAMG